MRFIYTKTFLIFSVCLVALTFFVFLQTKGWLDPIRSAVLATPKPIISLVKNVTLPIKNFFSTLYQLNKVVEENYNLKKQVVSLQQNLVDYQQQARENETLRKNLAFSQTTKLQLVACGVLSENSFGLNNSLILDCGTEKGVVAGQAIISQGYLVGKVLYAGKNSSTVLLANASDFSIDAKISQTNVNAIVKGSFGSGLIFDQLPQTASLEKGWVVVTAGINPQVPKNILIGQVGEILSTDTDLFKKAALTAPVNFNDLGFVFVVK